MPASRLRLPDRADTWLRHHSAQRELLERAYAEAVAVHSEEIRPDGHSRLDHVLSVAENVLRYRPVEPAVVAAALLHDVVEGGGAGLPDLEQRYGVEVTRLVDAVTKREGEDNLAAVQRAARAGREALYLRLCDRLDGVRRAPGRSPERAKVFLRTTQRVHWPYAHACFPPLALAMRRALESARRGLDSGRVLAG
jgi:(p)ppGpp synthase/HD superfamily hydrolase